MSFKMKNKKDFDFGNKGNFKFNKKNDYSADPARDYSPHNISARKINGTLKEQKKIRDAR
jgi:hypothetical protein